MIIPEWWRRVGCLSRLWRSWSACWGWWCSSWWVRSWHLRRSGYRGTAMQRRAADGQRRPRWCRWWSWRPGRQRRRQQPRRGWLLAIEEVLEELLDLGDPGGAADQDDVVDGGFVHLGVSHGLLDGLEGSPLRGLSTAPRTWEQFICCNFRWTAPSQAGILITSFWSVEGPILKMLLKDVE